MHTASIFDRVNLYQIYFVLSLFKVHIAFISLLLLLLLQWPRWRWWWLQPGRCCWYFSLVALFFMEQIDVAYPNEIKYEMANGSMKCTQRKHTLNHGALLLFKNEKSNSFNSSFFFSFGSLRWRMLHSYTPSHPLRLLTRRCNHLPSFCPCTKVRLTFRDQTTNSN